MDHSTQVKAALSYLVFREKILPPGRPVDPETVARAAVMLRADPGATLRMQKMGLREDGLGR